MNAVFAGRQLVCVLGALCAVLRVCFEPLHRCGMCLCLCVHIPCKVQCGNGMLGTFPVLYG